MNRFYLFVLFFCFTNIINISSANEVSSLEDLLNPTGNSTFINEQTLTAISASITGPASVCLNSTNQYVTLTGIGGTTPYTFRYKIDNVLQPSISTGASNSSITIPITTTTQKVYNFALDSVIDVNNKQSQTGTVIVSIKSLPNVNFTYTDNQCTGSGVQFTPSLTGPYTYFWEFGDGTTSTESNPTHLFNSFSTVSQTYSVKLTITDNSTTCQDSKTLSLIIKQTPDPALDISNNNGSLTPFDKSQQIFINCGATTSSPLYEFVGLNASNTITTNTGYTIDWGDGFKENLLNTLTIIKHKYSSLGYFDIKVTANNSNTNCSVTKSYKFFNGNTPAGNLRSIPNTQDCVPYTLVWQVDGVQDNTPGTKYTFHVDDGSTDQIFTQSNLPSSISHTFTTSSCSISGSRFTLSFNVQNPCGDNPTTQKILATEKPIAKFSISPDLSVCLNSPVTFTNSSIGSYATGSSCTNIIFDKTWSILPNTGWSGTLSNNNLINISFNTAGDYNVKLKIIRPGYPDSRCTSDSLIQTIHVKSLPTATISGTSSVCQNSTEPLITFTGANGIAPYTFTYTVNGTTRFIKTSSGNQVTVNAPTNVAGLFSYKLVSVQESSPSACSQTQTGSATITVIPTPTASISGKTSVCLNSTSPSITFTGSNGTPPYTFTYTLNGGANQTITTTAGNSSIIQVPTDVAGLFRYNLIGVKDANINACTQTLNEITSITVNPAPTVNVIPTQIKCNGEMSDLITFTGAIAGTIYKWTNSNPSIGLLTSGTGNIPSFVLNNGLTTPLTSTITVTPSSTNTESTCTGNPTSFTITVNPSPTITIQPQSSQVCQGGIANLLTVGITGLGTPGYQWYRSSLNSNKTGTPILNGIQQNYDPPTGAIDTLYYYCSITFSGGGCSNLLSNTASVIVSPIPVIKNQPVPQQTLCIGSTIPVPLSVSFSGGAGKASYQWYSSDKNSTTGGILIPNATNFNYTPPVFSTIGKYYYYAEIKFEGSACGLISSDSAKIIVTTIPTITLQPEITQTLCQNSAPINLSVSATGGSGLFSYQWYSSPLNNTGSGSKIINATGDVYTPLTTTVGTTYFFCIISQPNNTGCSVTSNISELIVKASPAFTKQPVSSTVCLGDKPLILNVAYSNGTLNPQIQWYSNTANSISGGTAISGATNASFNPPSESADTLYYYCTVTFSTVGCSSITSDIAKVIVNALPVISTYAIEINSGETFTVTPNTLKGDIVPVGTTYTWTTPVINPLNSISGATSEFIPQTKISASLTNNTTGIVTVTYSVSPTSGNCTGKNFNVIVTVNPPVNPTAILINNTCFGSNDGSIQTSIKGGVPFKTGNPYLVTWTGPNGFTSTNTTISNLFPGIYILTIKDFSGFTISFNYAISEPEALNLKTISTKDVSCFGISNGEIVLELTGGTLPYKYAWKKDANPYDGTNDVANLGPGNYSVSATDANNCGPVIASFLITEPSAMVIALNAQTNLMCYGDTNGAVSVSIEGGVPLEKTPGVFEYTYSWSGPNEYTSTEKDLLNIAAGIYTLTVTDKTDCNRIFTATITQPSEININAITSPVTCYGENNASIKLDIQGGNPPYQIQWSNFGKGLLQENLSPGTYTITVTDSHSCSTVKEVIITEAEFSIQPTVKNITCFGAQNGSINLNIKGGIPPVTLSWEDNPTAGSTRNGLKAGTYKATLSDGSSCSFTRSFMIIEPTELKISGRIANAYDCNNQNSGSIDLSIAGGTQPYTISWSNGDTTAHLSAIPAGNYVVEVTDARGCVYNGKFEVIRPAPIQLAVKSVPDYDCQSKVIKIISTAQITGGLPPYQFTWSSGSSKGLNNETMETSQPGIYVLGVIDGKGCTANYSFKIDVPDPGIDYQIINCDNHIFAFKTIIPIGLASDYTYLWDFGDGKTDLTQNPQHTFQSSGAYRVSLTLKGSTCTSVFEKIITVESSPVLILDKLPIFCIGDSLLLHISGAKSYRWYNGSTNDSLLIKSTGDYSVSGISNAGCTATLNFKVVNFDSYNFTIQSDKNEVTTVDPTIQLWSESITFSKYFWDFGDDETVEGNNQTHIYNNLKNGYYDVKLKVMNPNGCMEYATKRIWITNTSTGNVFTPNGDGVDDVFMLGWHVQIYNRNGILLYDGIEGWNGTFKGKPVTNDTYFYVLYISGEKGIKTRTGFVTVVR